MTDKTGQPRRRRRWVWTTGGLVALLVAAVVTVAVTYPVVAAVACPGCYGLERLSPGVYAERGGTQEQRQEITAILATADTRIRGFFGSRDSSPRILICRTTRCYQHIGGGQEKGQALWNRAMLLSPDGVNPVIATHELSHVEFHQRLGSHRQEVPRWFDEGLAVLVSGDARYLAGESTADRCLVTHEEALTVTTQPWSTPADGGEHAYTLAACVVSTWVGGHGGPGAVLDLIRRLAAGEAFTTVVQP